jgi:hypothetical protein
VEPGVRLPFRIRRLPAVRSRLPPCNCSRYGRRWPRRNGTCHRHCSRSSPRAGCNRGTKSSSGSRRRKDSLRRRVRKAEDNVATSQHSFVREVSLAERRQRCGARKRWVVQINRPAIAGAFSESAIVAAIGPLAKHSLPAPAIVPCNMLRRSQ